MLLRCPECHEQFQLIGEHEALLNDLNRGPVKCPVCFSVSVVPTTIRKTGQPIAELTAQQFWTATNGFGMPDEIVTEPETIEAMLLAHRIKGVKLHHTVSRRVVVSELELDNGITLHFTASGEGAVIFKSTRTKEKKEDAS